MAVDGTTKARSFINIISQKLDFLTEILNNVKCYTFFPYSMK